MNWHVDYERNWIGCNARGYFIVDHLERDIAHVFEAGAARSIAKLPEIKRAVGALWDAVSDLLETPGVEIPEENRELLTEAIEELQNLTGGE